MASASDRTICVICQKEKITYSCQGCLQRFCLDDLPKHRQILSQQLDQLQNDHDQLRQYFNDQKFMSTEHPSIKQIDQWEKDSIDKIKQTAQQCREKFFNYSNRTVVKVEKKLNDLARRIKEINEENEFNEIDLNDLKQRLEKLQEELNRPTHISIEQPSVASMGEISLLLPFEKGNDHVNDFDLEFLSIEIRWKQMGTTVAGGNGRGNRSEQLSSPFGILLDEWNQTIYIADYNNHRIVEWRLKNTNGRTVAGGNKHGDRIDQLKCPTDVVIDRQDNSLIIADRLNRRVMRWFRQASRDAQIIIADIDCWGLATDEDGSLYVSDSRKNEVKRWKKGETQGTIVAGGNGQGDQLDQFHYPTCLFLDDDHTLYIADQNNHRVMKWIEGAREGIIVAGANGNGNQMKQLSHPAGVVVDQLGQIFVADAGNGRMMRWYEGAKEGTIAFGAPGTGQQTNQLAGPMGLSLDRKGNLYVADSINNRIQKFEVA